MEEKLICITTVKSRIEAEQMLSFLKENGIYAHMVNKQKESQNWTLL